MPLAGGAYDQDMDLVNAVAIVESIKSFHGLDAAEAFSLPRPARRLRSAIRKYADGDHY